MKVKYPVLLFYVFLVFAATIAYLYSNMNQLQVNNNALLMENDSLISANNSMESKLRKLEPQKEFRYLK